MTTIHRWRAFAVLAVSFFMTIVDLTIVNVALPTIGRDLDFSESGLQWVVTAYGLTFGGLLLLGGRAADLLGRRLIFMLGLVVFTAVWVCTAIAVLAVLASFVVPRRTTPEPEPVPVSAEAWSPGHLALETDRGTP
jgi:MFS family permease